MLYDSKIIIKYLFEKIVSVMKFKVEIIKMISFYYFKKWVVNNCR